MKDWEQLTDLLLQFRWGGTKNLSGNKNGTNDKFSHLSHQVTPKVQMSNSFIEECKKIVALKL
jgi:hypothetical protein